MTNYASFRVLSFWPLFIAAFIVFLTGCGGEPANSPTLPVSSVETPIPTTVPLAIADATVIPEAIAELRLTPAPSPSPTLDTPLTDTAPADSPAVPSPGAPGTTSNPKTPSTPTPSPSPTRDSFTVSEAKPADTPILVATATSTPIPEPTATSTPIPEPTPDRFGLRLLSPQNGAAVEINAVRVLGLTRPDSVVEVNGNPVSISAAGLFQHDLLLVEGGNLIEVIATHLSGKTDSRQRAVFFLSPTAGIPLGIFYPADGQLVTHPTVQVLGGTSQDAVVGINGIPVAVNDLGIFSTTVLLQEGSNLIEVMAVDIQQNVTFKTAAVFYEP